MRLDGSEVAMSDPFFTIKRANVIADLAQREIHDGTPQG